MNVCDASCPGSSTVDTRRYKCFLSASARFHVECGYVKIASLIASSWPLLPVVVPLVFLCTRQQHNLLGMAAVAQLKTDPQYSAVHELLHIFSVEKLGEYMAFHKVRWWK